MLLVHELFSKVFGIVFGNLCSRGTTSEHDHAEQRAEHQRGANRAVLLTNPGPPAPPQR